MDTICLVIAMELLLFLNGSILIIRSLQDKLIFLSFSLLCILIFRGYSMFLRFTTFIDISKLSLGLLMSIVCYSVYIGADTKAHYNYLLLLFYFSLSLLVFYRLIIKILYSRTTKDDMLLNTLLYGAGTNGLRVKRALDDSNSIKVVGFLDDDKSKTGRTIEGLPVQNLNNYFQKTSSNITRINQIIITTNNLTQKNKNTLFNIFKNKKVKIFKVPSIDNLAVNKGAINNLAPFKIEDLLKRDQIKIDLQKNKKLYFKKTILVTGAAGSIGSEIVRQLLNFSPKEIILFDNNENSLFNIKKELEYQKSKTNFHYLLKSVTDLNSVDFCFSNFEIDVVFHAAAYKHVYMTENMPQTTILNNILGTKHVIDTSIKKKVSTFVFVSTDKAVNPTNIMGATKRIAEMYVSALSSNNKTKIITTRFGNVLGSNGSVVPIFQSQIAKGGPVTVTHPEVTRFFMTITEACQLVLEAGATGNHGEIYVFDMGGPVKIIDLAINMIRLSGLIENEDIDIKFTGLNEGEKLYEELLTNHENLKKSHNKLIFIAEKEKIYSSTKTMILKLIEDASNSKSTDSLVSSIMNIVPEFQSTNSNYKKLI
ncbi:polysaccharide biosynthesis protein [Bacteroidota bacterium]|nr:polysaccharide biosynthesis protein [Bacteroidota bacterium]